MRFLVHEVKTASSATIRVDLDGNAANVMLMDVHNFQHYRQGRRFQYLGGFARQSPVRLRAPSAGHWYVVVDLGGRAGRVSAAVTVLN